MEIHERIKRRRKELGLTVDDVASALGLSRATIYRYESAEIENMGIDKIKPLAKVLKTTPAILMGWGLEEISGDMGEFYLSKTQEALSNSGYFLEYKEQEGELFVFIKNINNEVVFASRNQDFLKKMSEARLDYDKALSLESLFAILGGGEYDETNIQINPSETQKQASRKLRSVARLQEWDDVTESEDNQLSDFIDFLRAKREKEFD